MECTFGQAKAILRSASHLHGDGCELGDQINAAVAALAELSGWTYFRRLVRTFSDRPVFALPQGASELVRVCINGKPASLHQTDYQFLHSGPGDLDRFRARGFRLLPSADVADLGTSPIMFQPQEPVFLCAASPQHDESSGEGLGFTVTGVLVTGERATVRLPVTEGDYGVYPDYSHFDTTRAFASIEHVVLDHDATEYTTLYGLTPRGSFMMLGHYHPSIRVPKFRVYEVAAGQPPPYDILAEVRVSPLPCIRDDDVLPVPSIEPVKHMLLHNAALAMNEGKDAQGHLQQAMQWLQQMEVADNTIQAPVVHNVLFDGSCGQLADDFENL